MLDAVPGSLSARSLGRFAWLTTAVAAVLAALAMIATPAPATGFGVMAFPVAVIDASSTYVRAGTPVTFNGSRSYGIELSVVQRWDWDFGDGTTASGAVVDHPFATPGMKTVTLTVTDQYGTTDTETQLVAVWEYPDAVVTASPARGPGPLTVSFDGSASTSAGWDFRSQVWDFGDGTTATGPVATHTYTTPGTYIATFTVTNLLGWGDTANQRIDVTEPMAAPLNLKAASATRGSVTLSWTNRMTSVASTEVQRCAGATCTTFATVGFVPNTATTYTEGGLKRGATYRYRLKITDIVGTVGYSNLASVKVR